MKLYSGLAIIFKVRYNCNEENGEDKIKDMKKIMFLMPNKTYSGAEKVSIDIIKYLKDKYDFFYVSESGEINEYLEENNIRHVVTSKNLNLSEIKRIIDIEKPDIIHCSDYRASTKMALINTNIPIISHLHNNPLWLKKICINSIAYFVVSKRFKKILTVSDSIKDEYIFSRFLKDKIVMIDNPISVSEVRNKVDFETKKEFDICFSGRLKKEKNPIRFINIIEKLKKYYPNIKVMMLGDGELKEKCIQKIKEKNLEDNIKLLGFVKNPYQEMIKAKMFVLPSEWEGFGLVAFEAISLGLPCVVSDVGGLGSIVDNSCGKLCNNDDEFINEIKSFIDDKEKLQRYSKNAMKKAERIENLDRYMKKIEEIYESE